jgi:hypothetical protein
MFTGKSEDKILSWRNFRQSLSTWPEDIEKVAKVWAKAPQVNNYLTYDDPKKWPDAWTLINEGIYCNISIALGMFYTLYYSNYNQKESMKINCYHLPEKHQILNLVSLEDGKYMLNYNLAESVNILTVGHLPSPKYILTEKDLPIRK